MWPLLCIRQIRKQEPVYAYQQENVRDPVTNSNKVRRTYLGRVDPETKMIIKKAESGKRNRSKVGDEAMDDVVIPHEIYATLEEHSKQLGMLSEQMSILNQTQKDMEQKLRNIVLNLRKALDGASL